MLMEDGINVSQTDVVSPRISFQGDQLNIQEEEEVEEEDEGEGEEEIVTTQPSAESSGGSSPTEQGDVNGGGVAVGDSGNNEEGAGEEGMISTNPDVRDMRN